MRGTRGLAKVAAGIYALSLVGAVAACDQIFGLEQGTLASPDAGMDLDAAPVDATVDARAPGDAGRSDVTSDALAPDAPAFVFPVGDVCLGFEARLGSCDGGSTNLAADPHNCGRCGHDCFYSATGACSGGQCQPQLLYQEANEGGTPVYGGSAVGVVNGELFWAYPLLPSGYVIRKMSVGLAPGAPVDIVYVDSLNAVAVDPSGVYYGRPVAGPGTEIYRVGLGGGAPGLIMTINGGARIALDDQYIYLSDLSGSVYSLAKNAPDAGATTIGAQANPDYLSAAQGTLAWINAANTAGASVASSPAGGSFANFLQPAPNAAGLALTAASYFYFDVVQQAVVAIPMDGGALAQVGGTFDDSEAGITTPQAAHGVLAQPSGSVVVGIVGQGNGEFNVVAFCPGASPPAVLYSDTGHGNNLVYSWITDDPAFVYWAQYGGALRRLAK